MLYVFLAILLIACQTSNLIFDPTPYAYTWTNNHHGPHVDIWTSMPTVTQMPMPVLMRVIILSIDGLRPMQSNSRPCQTCCADEDQRLPLTAQTIFPSATLPAHSSMLTGLCPRNMAWTGTITSLKRDRAGHRSVRPCPCGGNADRDVRRQGKTEQVTDAASVDTFVYINDRDKVIMQECWQISRWISGALHSLCHRRLDGARIWLAFARTSQRHLSRRRSHRRTAGCVGCIQAAR